MSQDLTDYRSELERSRLELLTVLTDLRLTEYIKSLQHRTQDTQN